MSTSFSSKDSNMPSIFSIANITFFMHSFFFLHSALVGVNNMVAMMESNTHTLVMTRVAKQICTICKLPSFEIFSSCVLTQVPLRKVKPRLSLRRLSLCFTSHIRNNTSETPSLGTGTSKIVVEGNGEYHRMGGPNLYLEITWRSSIKACCKSYGIYTRQYRPSCTA